MEEHHGRPAATVPTCWKCGYVLSGLTVDSACPECGTPVWSGPPPVVISRDARSSRTWGVASLVSFFVFLGPLAALAAIPAIVLANRALRSCRAGKADQESIAGAKAGRRLGWITVWLSIGFVAVAAGFVGLDHLGVRLF